MEAGGGWAARRRAGEKPLLLQRRRVIACHTARALAYLHCDCSPPILHRDVKAANVLLAPTLEAALGDFGVATHVSAANTGVRGTHGHVAPGPASCLMPHASHLMSGPSGGRLTPPFA